MGIKVFVLCGKSGLAYFFLLYQGSTTELGPEIRNKFGLGPAVVLHLCHRITNPGHELFYDNYFSSYNLLKELKLKKIYAAGTVRVNRFANPPLIAEIEEKKKKRGYSEEVVSTDVDVMVKWIDNRSVTLASNYIGVGEKDKVRRWDKKLSKYIQKQRDLKYNHSMGAVNLLDQLITLYDQESGL